MSKSSMFGQMWCWLELVCLAHHWRIKAICANCERWGQFALMRPACCDGHRLLGPSLKKWKDETKLVSSNIYCCFPFFHLKGPSNVNDCRNSKYFFSRIGILSCFGNCFGWNWLSFLTQSLFWKFSQFSQQSRRILMALRQFVRLIVFFYTVKADD